MIVNVIGCGPSAALWDGCGPSIGVNDCLKFGKPVDALVCVNSNFEPERMKWIQAHKGPFYSTMYYWSFKADFRPIQTRSFRGRVEGGKIYHSISSPFIAISLAFNQGAKEIVLWGVDFESHPIVKDRTLEREVRQYMKFIEALEKKDCRVYLGTNSGAFKGLIPCFQQ